MPYSEPLAARIRQVLARKRGIEEKKMFGGIGFLLHGNLLVGVWKDSLVVRLSADDAIDGLHEAHVKPFDITGRPMKGWLLVAPAGLTSADDLESWLTRAHKFVRTLPAK
jgi:hypothetical protein